MTEIKNKEELKDEVQLTTPLGTMIFKEVEVDNWTGDVNVNPIAGNAIDIDEQKSGIGVFVLKPLNVFTDSIGGKYITADDIVKSIDLKQDKIATPSVMPPAGTADGWIDEKNQIRIYDKANESVAIQIIRDNKYSGLDTKEKTIIKAIDELVAVKQNVTDDKLVTEKKTIVEAINENNANIVLTNDSLANLSNDVKDNRSDIDSLKFQNFDIDFVTFPITASTFAIKLWGKITVGTGSLYTSVWSICSELFVSGIDIKIMDMGTSYACYPLNGEVSDDRKLITGVWTGDNFPIRSIVGMEIIEPSTNEYQIIFYDGITKAKAILTLSIPELVNTVKKEPKKYVNHTNIKMIELENKVQELLEFKDRLNMFLSEK